MMRGDGTSGGNGRATFKSVVIGNETIVNAGGVFSTNGQTLEIYEDPVLDDNNPKWRFTLSVNYISYFHHQTTKNFGEGEFIFILNGQKYPHLVRGEKWKVEVLIPDTCDVALMNNWLLGCLGKKEVERLRKRIPRSLVNRFFRPELFTAYSTTTKVSYVLVSIAFWVNMAQHCAYLTGACERGPGAPSALPREICRVIQYEQAGAEKGEAEAAVAIGSHVAIYDPDPSWKINEAIIRFAGNMVAFLSWKTAAFLSSIMWAVRILKTIKAYFRYAFPKCLRLVKPWTREVTEKQHRKEVDLFWEREQQSPPRRRVCTTEKDQPLIATPPPNFE